MVAKCRKGKTFRFLKHLRRVAASGNFTCARMPGFPVTTSEPLHSRGIDQPSNQDARVQLSAEEQVAAEQRLAAEESLSIYCQPIELYNILHRRARKNPLFLQRCLDYRIKAKNKKRIQMTVSLAWSDAEAQSVFPLYICLAKRDSDNENADYSAVYQVSRIFFFRSSSGTKGNNHIKANFVLPEVNKLATEATSGSHFLLFFTTVYSRSSSSRIRSSPGPPDLTSYESKSGENCLCGKVSLESLYMAWNSSPNFSLGLRAEFMSTVDLLPCILKYDFQNKGQSISIQDSYNSEKVSTSKQVQMTISAEEFGAKDKSPYHAYGSSDVSSTSLSHIVRLKEGNVTFNYRYYNNKLQRTEAHIVTESFISVTEDFSCPFCLVGCASYKGLGWHLVSSHDLFNFEMSASEDCQAVNVSMKTDIWNYEIVADGIDPKLQTFTFCAKPLKRRRPKVNCSENAMDVDPPVLAEDADPPILAMDTDPPDLVEDADPMLLDSEIPLRGVSNPSIVSDPEPGSNPPISEHGCGTLAVLHVDKTGSLPDEHSNRQIIARWRRRQFYHSQKAQPMALEEVIADPDSEDEDDEEANDIKERLKLDLLDLDKEKKKFMFMWNSFVRRHRVLADCHVNWTCKAFSTFYGPEIVRSPSLLRCWKVFMIRLHSLGLVNGQIFNESGIILEQYERQNMDTGS